MGKFFNSTYEDYYNVLSNSEGLKTSTDNIKSIVEEANSSIGVFMDLVGNELDGQYCNELEEGLESLKIELETLLDIINNDLDNVISALENMGSELKKLKNLDIKYDSAEKEIEALNYEYKDYKDISYLMQVYQRKLDNINSYKSQIEQEANELIESIEEKLTIIDEFNNTIVEISMILSVFDESGVEVDDFESLTKEEEEERIKQLIEAFTEQYTVYKEAYEKYAKWNLTREEQEVFTAILSCLGIDSQFSMASIRGYTDKEDWVNLGFATKDLLNVLITNNVKESLENYLVKGQSWVESGMDAIAKKFNRNEYDESQISPEAERAMAEARERTFLTGVRSDSKVRGYNNDPKELYKLFSSAYDKLESNNALFEQNYNNCVNTGVSIKGLQSRLKTVKYDDIFNSDDFNNYKAQYQSGKAGYSKDYDILPEEEKRKYEYLFEKYGAEKAAQYMEDINEFIVYTKGMKKGLEAYQNPHDGNWDAIEALGIGYGDGFKDFVCGFPNIVSPQHVLTENDYARMALLQMLNENPAELQSVLYQVGSMAGRATIPAIAYLALPKSFSAYVAAGLYSLSDMGIYL